MADAITQFSAKINDVWQHSFLSNGFIESDGSFVEREYQAAKAADPADTARIMACAKPFGEGGAKQLGRSVKQRSDWEEIKYQTMTRLVLAKFLDHPELAHQLLDTGDALLVEGNTWHDNTWGNCICGSRDRHNCVPPGSNWLGQILMSTRETLRQIFAPCNASVFPPVDSLRVDMEGCLNIHHLRVMRSAEAMAAAITHYTRTGLLDMRSVPADALLCYMDQQAVWSDEEAMQRLQKSVLGSR